MWDIYLQAVALLMSYRVTPKKIVKKLEETVTPAPPLEYIAPELVRGATVQLSFRTFKNLDEYLAHISELVGAAVQNGANLIVLPEYAGMLAAGMIPSFGRIARWIGTQAPDAQILRKALEFFHHFISEAYLYTYGTLARLYSVYIAAGSCLFLENGTLHNRACVFGPDGEVVLAQEKLCPLGLEGELGVEPCEMLDTVETKIGKLAVLLGTDAYYCETAQILKAQGAEIVAAPVSLLGDLLEPLLHCRASESGAYLLLSSWSEMGAQAKIIAPAYLKLTEDAVLSETAGAHTQSACVRLNLTRLRPPVSFGMENPGFLTQDYIESYQNEE